MSRLAALRIRPKLIGLLFITGLIPMVVVTFIASRLASEALIHQSFAQLNAVQSIRKVDIESYFHERLADIRVLAESERISELSDWLMSPEQSRDPLERLTFDGALQGYLQAYGYTNLFLIDANRGEVQFAVNHRELEGRQLNLGLLQDSGLARAWMQVTASNSVALIDFAPFESDQGRETAFLAYPISADDGSVSAVLVLQLSPELVTRIVDSREGMGDTGESYLMGVNGDGGRFEFRSNMRTMGEGRFVVGYALSQPLDYWQQAVEADIQGDSDIFIDSAGVPVLVSFNRLEIPGLQWYLISKVNQDEVTLPILAIYTQVILMAGLVLLFIAAAAWLFARTLTQPLIDGMEFAQSIAAGKLGANLPETRNDELGDLARALNGMARDLRDQHWLGSGKESLDDQLRGDLQVEELAGRFITLFSKHLDCQLGALYLLNEQEQLLELKASYAFTDRQGNFNRIQLGEGMVGQALLEEEVICFSRVSEGPSLNYGAGELVPEHFMAIPLAVDEHKLGAVLLGSVAPFTELQRRFIEQVMTNISVLFNAANARRVIDELLAQAQDQQQALKVTNEELEEQTEALRRSEGELQAQQEELRVANEELEEQAKVLKQSEAELQAQQEELRVTNEELEERTKALEEQKGAMEASNQGLLSAQEEARVKAVQLEEASKYKSEFLANMSHELRTPLNSILILSQLFANNKEGNLNDKQIEAARAINSSGSDLLELINEILDLSKIEAGKVELVVEQVGIESLFTDLERLYREIASDKGLEFQLNVAEEVPRTLTTDSMRLQQVLRNLLTNAFKFTHHGGVSLNLSRPDPLWCRERGISAEGCIAFLVQDDGIGISADKQQAIFQAFQQADGSTSRNYGGTGLGLSITKELTRLLGGSIHLHSEEGKGSCFTVVLPEKGPVVAGESEPADAEEIEVVPAPPQPKQPEVSSVSGGTLEAPGEESEFISDDRRSLADGERSLLIIEDDKAFAMVMRDFGRDRGFKCIVAADGETGLHFADYYKPSAIILDIGLPGIDGWTVMERLKENPDLRHIPVHFMSANDSTLDAMRMGAIGYLTKPVNLDQMECAFGKIEEIISKPVRRLLLVEDDDLQRQSIEELIGDGDVSTTAVGSGRAALEELEQHSYDCMVLDLGLEDMSGFELLDRIRQSETAARVPIIIYTGRDLAREEEKKLNRYAESIIIKGVKSPERLLDESALFLHRVEADMPEEKRGMLKAIHQKEGALSGKRILLVDDDMRNVFALSSVLEEKGMEVTIARNGFEALEKLGEMEQADGVLMDIMMPKMDGYEAMREIRKRSHWAKLPIIALTAKAMKGDRSKCIEAGASDYLAKPVDTDKLLSMLRVWLY
ncbi:signal transduction histidine kinase [Ferrimonas sediminum]|uniref:histidine kinase n=1 Tax=Ferrimonas sediminum TaxID=718193 RepID=A0A1G8TBG0_9GAMM|nr:response regulator [Ferrimonas sediminum]SDJ38020.1 signal transduction histidine kinase [Ferrimonas sediminum]